MKLAIFDIDGTLTQTMSLTDVLFIKAVSEVLGTDRISRDWSSYPHVTDSGILQHLFAEHHSRSPSDHEIRTIRTQYMTLLRSECPKASPVSGAAHVLRALGDAEWSVAIATGNWLEPAHHKLNACGVPFAGIPMATADDSHDRRAIVALAIERSGAPDRVVYLGDRPWDQAAAEALGVGFVAVGSHVPTAKLKLDDYGNMAAVLELLDAAT